MNTIKENKEELISKIYDYIVNVTILQKRLFPLNYLYGDGTRWKHDKKTFIIVYDEIKKQIDNNNLL